MTALDEIPRYARSHLITACPAPEDSNSWAPAERRQIAVPFCDPVGTVARTQNRDLEAHGSCTNRFYKVCETTLIRYGGHVAQILGDGIMLFFGWPDAHVDGALRSAHTALDMLREIKAIDTESPPAARIRITRGKVVVDETDTDTDE